MNSSIEPTLILGSGFVGLFTALHLSHKRYPLPTVLVDRSASFVFKPLLYEFFSGEMEADQICPRYEELSAGSDVTFVQDTVDAIDLNQRQVKLASGSSQRYSHLVLALGCTAGHSGLEGAIENSFPFRIQEDAIALAKQLQKCLQQAAQTSDIEQQQALLTVAVIGAGATGVELAATLADLLPNWYGQLSDDPQKFRIVLIDRGSGVLKGKGDSKGNLCHTAHEALMQKTIVELCLEADVTAVESGQITYKRHEQSETIQAATIVWTAGIATHPLIKDLPIAPEHRTHQGRLRVTPTLQLSDFPEVFAAGDCAEQTETLPPIAQVAYQQGAAIANNLIALAENQPLSPAQINLRGTLLKLGLGESAADLFDRFEIKGHLGHLIRQATYLELLPTHNFKATTEWLMEEIFHHHSSQPTAQGLST